MKILSGLLSALLITLLIFAFLLYCAFAGLYSEDTVVKTLKSPNNTYVANIINSDQGALGGNTDVEISKTEKFNIIIGNFSRIPKRVYSGKYEEYKAMDISWKNETTLVINGKEFDMNQLY
ncbi:MAG TPA: DUF5412 family protein [Oscillospiraceae bacterium]|nr:DUF5412 family protein [Oscillospiraceae bacterium]